jgi:hypothetical protein
MGIYRVKRRTDKKTRTLEPHKGAPSEKSESRKGLGTRPCFRQQRILALA